MPSPICPLPKFGQSVEISLISFCILGPFHVVKHTTWLFQEFPIPLISTIFSWESTAQFALSVVILTDATRNHWITGHRGRGSPPPRHQALRPPPPPLPGTFSAKLLLDFFYCHLDVIGPLLCYYTKTPYTGSPTSTRYLAHQDERSGFSWLSSRADFKRL